MMPPANSKRIAILKLSVILPVKTAAIDEKRKIKMKLRKTC
jgi:PII-like signaling protein